MSTQLAKQILMRMRAKDLSATALEKEAGLKGHSVHNILRGRSKRPSADVVQAVADVLGCTVKDLLADSDFFQADEPTEYNKDVKMKKVPNPQLFLQTAKIIIGKLEKNETEVTAQQLLTCVEEVFLHSLQKDPSCVDEDFADWFIEIVTN